MEPATVAILATAGANAVVVIAGLALWLGHRARRAPRPEQLELLTQRLEERLTELTRAVDVVAVEVERVAEAQRHLLLERTAHRPVPPPSPSDVPGTVPGRVVTPH